MSPGSRESQSPELAKRSVPPFWSDGLCTPFASAALPPPLPDPPEEATLPPPQAATEQVEGQHRHEDRQAGEHHEIGRDLEPVRGVGEHAAPTGRRRADPD